MSDSHEPNTWLCMFNRSSQAVSYMLQKLKFRIYYDVKKKLILYGMGAKGENACTYNSVT